MYVWGGDTFPDANYHLDLACFEDDLQVHPMGPLAIFSRLKVIYVLFYEKSLNVLL